MVATIWKKISRDLTNNKFRSILVVIAISIGVFGAGSILTGYTILKYEINANYNNTNPANIRISVDTINESTANAIAKIENINDVELRGQLKGRIQTAQNEWSPIILYVIDDFNNLRVSTFTKDNGTWPTANTEIMLERSSISLEYYPVGAQILIKTPNGEPKNLSVSGQVHDAGRAPGWQDGIDYGYITLQSLSYLGEQSVFNELHITVNGDIYDETYVSGLANQIKKQLLEYDIQVFAVYLPVPGVHPHADQMDSLLFLLQAFGGLTLVLSSVLVYNNISSLLSQEIKQIGIMKSIGGSRKSISKIYFGNVILLGSIAIIIGLPLGTMVGKGYAELTARILNFNITKGDIPIWVYVAQIITGMGIPILAAFIPILIATRVPTRDALTNLESDTASFGKGITDSLLTKLNFLNRPLLLSLRNTFRKKVRLSLVIIVLALSGAIFISALNVSDSWINTIDSASRSNKFDYRLDLAQSYDSTDIQELISNVTGVSIVETWEQRLAVHEKEDGTDSLRFYVSALPVTTKLIDYPLLRGNWLNENSANQVVINHQLYYSNTEKFEVGKTIKLRFENKSFQLTIVGVVNEIGAPRRGTGTPASAYMDKSFLDSALSNVDSTNHIRIKTTGNSNQEIAEISHNVEKKLNDANYKILDAQLSSTRLQILREHLVVILFFLLFMALLSVIVGGLALSSIISINVLERYREIGIMRATGAKNRSVKSIFMTEGLVVTLLSWVVAVILSYPLSVIIGNYAGWVFIQSELNNIFPIGNQLLWLIFVIIISLIASYYPSWKATKPAVRNLLAYE